MALMNKEELSPFAQRLKGLMEEKEITSPKKLAEQLLEAKLVKVDRKPRSDEVYDTVKSSIGSVEKKIQKHLKAEDSSCLQGEFVLAYSRYFGCCSDYLMGLTDYRSSDREVEDICKKTKLSETAVTRLIQTASLPEKQWKSDLISDLLSSSFYGNYPEFWKRAKEQKCKQIQLEQTIAHAVLDREAATDPEERRQLDYVAKHYAKQNEDAELKYRGMLYSCSHELDRFTMESLQKALNAEFGVVSE